MGDWKYTIPVLRAEEREDGKYLVGEATGPEPDSHGTQMDPEAIADFTRQIAEKLDAGDPLPYIDNHAKGGVLRTLGAIIEGSITPDFHLKVLAKLDEANPAAMYLWHQAKQGKQFGMSIAGDGVAFKVARTEDGKKVIKFTKVILREISNTTRPSWVPSFGTVLARSIDQGDNEVPDELAREETAVEQTTPAETSEVAADVENSDEQTETTETNPVEDQTEETVERTADQTDETPVADVERARISQRDAEAVRAATKAFLSTLAQLGISLDETPESTPPATETTTTVVENSETAEEETVEVGGVTVQRSIADAMTALIEREVSPLREELRKKDEYIDQLLKMPAGKTPAPIVREKFADDTTVNLPNDPEERLRYALTQLYGGR
jgi:hypothetical protein